MKKFISLLLTLAMVLSLAVPALAAEPNITGNQSGEVTAAFAPEIYLSGISVTGDTVTYDPETNTYIAVFSVGAESITYKTVYTGKNLAYYRDAADKVKLRDTSFRDGSVAQEYESYMSENDYFSYDEATGSLTRELTPANTAVGLTAVFEYSNDGGRTWQEACTLVFVQAYSVSIDEFNAANADVTVDKTQAIEGETVTVTAVPHQGYRLDGITVGTEGGAFQATMVDEDTFTFTMPDEAVTLTPQIKKLYAVNIAQGITGGTVTPSMTEAANGDKVYLQVAAEDGYRLDTLTVTDDITGQVRDVDAYDQHSFYMYNSSVTVNATFVAVTKTYSVTVSETAGGTVTADRDTYAQGDTVSLSLVPQEGYQLGQVVVTNVTTGETIPVASHTNNVKSFIMPDSNVTVTATFYKPAVITGIALEVDGKEYTSGYAVATPDSTVLLKLYGTDLNNANGAYYIWYGLFGLPLNEFNWEFSQDNTEAVAELNLQAFTVGDDYEMKYKNPSDSDYSGLGLFLSLRETAAEAEITGLTVTGGYSIEEDGGIYVVEGGKGITVTVTGENFAALTEDHKVSIIGTESLTAANGWTIDTEANTAVKSFAAAELSDGTAIQYRNPGDTEAKDSGYSIYLLKPGTALDTIYFNNGGNSDWTTVQAYFYKSSTSHAGTLSMTMAETNIYATKGEIPELAYYVEFVGIDSGDTGLIRIPTDGSNMYNLADGTWSVYEPSTSGTASAEITWGSMSFTYTDGENGAEGAWSADTAADAGTVTVTNTGTAAITASAAYTPKEGYTEIDGTLGDAQTLAAGEEATFTLTLTGKPGKALHGEPIGTVTVTIE